MNLNDFVVFPNKPRSVKLNVRSLRELRRDTAQLDQENKDLESRLRQLRETMSREKEEREMCGALRWRSAQPGAPAMSKEKATHKLSASKMKIRVLKSETLPEAPRPAERVVHPLPGAAGSRRRFQLRGKPCGQCEARSAGLMCAECGEDYCVGCFAKFHQKGALKHHRMIPQKAELHTSISSLDVLARFRSQTAQQRGWSVQSPHHTAADSNAMEADPRWGAAAGHFSPMADRHAQNAQALFLNEGKEMEDEHNEGSLLRGHFDEEESSRSFQLALAEWRERRQAAETTDEREHHQSNMVPAVWPEVEAMGTQAEGRSQQPIHIEFREHGLSYMERLLLKQHRRRQSRSYQLLSAPSSLKGPLPHSASQPPVESHELTDEELDQRRYCASLFAVPGPARGEGSGDTSVVGLSIMKIDQDAGDTLVNGTAGVQQRDDKKKPVQGRGNLFTFSRSQEEKEVLWPEESLHSSPSSPAVPTEVTAELAGQPPPYEQLLPLVTSQKLQAPESEGPSVGSSSSAQLSARSSSAAWQVQPPRLSDLAQPHTSRRSPASNPSLKCTESALSSSPALSRSGGGSPSCPVTQDWCSSLPPPPLRPPLVTSPQRVSTVPVQNLSVRSSQTPLSNRAAIPGSPFPSPTPCPSPAHCPSQHQNRSIRPGSQPASVKFPVPADTLLSSCSPESRDSLCSSSGCPHPSANSARSTDLHGTPPLFLPPQGSELSPLMSLSDSDRSSDCADMIPIDEDSSDEEIKRCAGHREREEQEEDEREEKKSSSSPLQRSPSPGGDDPLPSQDFLHAGQATPPSGLFTEPSLVLSSLAQRETSISEQYQGLEGFLTLGLDTGRVQPSPASPHTPPQRPAHLEALVGGQGSWRPASSLLLHAEEELVTAVINSQLISRSPHAVFSSYGVASPWRKNLSDVTRC
ncbi:uncharacterized protein zbbx isoform X2 [Electrophorus electricus]|uniref:uncharacterized protein zbbx isoform X2 n=1 Tax=Electrophorus electricus TaxID=8005 RepID=UPI0015D0ACA9|nr:uncharacterized protein zbbx isoform X2 [Electrophorus electricus]